MNRTEAPSAQCKSSTTSNCGRPAASAATSQYRPWRTPNEGSASPGGAAPSGNTIGAASAAAPVNVRPRSSPDMPRSLGSSSCRTTPHAYARSNSDPRAPATAKLRARAVSVANTQEAGLADARRSLHDDRASRARDHLVERIGDHAQVALSLVEPADHARRRVYACARTSARSAMPHESPRQGPRAVEHPAEGRPFGCCRTRSPGKSKCRRT